MNRPVSIRSGALLAAAVLAVLALRSVLANPPPEGPSDHCYPGIPLVSSPLPVITSNIAAGDPIFFPVLAPPGVSDGLMVFADGTTNVINYSNGPVYFVRDSLDAYIFHVRAKATAYCAVSFVAPCTPVIDYKFEIVKYLAWSDANSLPIIITQPTDQTVFTNQWTVFTVAATGPGPLTYTWRFNGINSGIGWGLDWALPMGPPNNHRAGNYDVVIRNSHGAVTSRVALLTILPETISLGDMWYVNAQLGNDATYNGHAPRVYVGSGPFATINKALTSAGDGDTVVVLSGAYAEDVDLRGRDLNFQFNGNVILH